MFGVFEDFGLVCFVVGIVVDVVFFVGFEDLFESGDEDGVWVFWVNDDVVDCI